MQKKYLHLKMATLVLPGLADLVWVIRIFMDVLVMMKLPDAWVASSASTPYFHLITDTTPAPCNQNM